ncbi:MAG: BspA family leucine-rich repeat surface protein [Bacteroidales bacterium]|nr:BspA family leucine-rich repeat surface protein [Bacteroidales bacterium]
MKTKTFLKITVLGLIFMLSAVNANAQFFYSILDNGTLTFYYGTPTSQQTSWNTYRKLDGQWDYQYKNADYAEHIIRVEFDNSMKSKAPYGINLWFQELKNLEEVTGLGYISTSNISTLQNMFNGCKKLRKVEFKTGNYSFNTANIDDMFGMFYECESLRALDLSEFNTGKVTRMQNMFAYCSSLETILVGSGWSVSQITEQNGSGSRDMFFGCSSLYGAIRYNSSYTDKTYANTTNGYLISAPSSTTAYAHYKNGTLSFFNDKFYNKNTNCYTLNTGDNDPGWISHAEDVTKVVFDPSFDNIHPTSCYKWFSGCKSLTTIDGINYLHLTTDTKNTAYMFHNCESLTKLQLSGSVYKVTDFSDMFSGCSNLKTLDLPSRPSYSNNPDCNMANMFAGCQSLTTINFLDGFYTNKATDMSYMFSGCTGITNFSSALDVANCLITNMCTNMQGMFSQCSGATDFSILTLFDTRLVTNMSQMFYKCEKIQELRLEKFNTSKVTTIKAMFAGCTNLNTIYASDYWSTQNVTDNRMCFSSCKKIKGGKGTEYIQASGDYAHIDQGSSNPGYFTPYSSKITYKLNGGSMSGNPSDYTVETDDFKLNNPTRSGYIFEGWSGTGINGISTSITIKRGSTYPREYTAHWKCDLSSYSNTVVITPSSTSYTGKPISLAVTVNGEILREGYDFTFSDPYLEIIAPKSYSIKINGVGNYTNSRTINITISKAPVTITPDAITKIYGDPEPELTYTVEGLVNGDKLISFSIVREEGEDAGTYAIATTATASNNYVVTCKSGEFVIAPKTIVTPTVLLESNVVHYTGSAIKPEVKIFDGSKEIPSSEYIITYTNNTNIGEATITVNNAPNGNYILGSASVNFSIVNSNNTYTITYVTNGIGDDGKSVLAKKDATTTQPSFLNVKGYTLEGVFRDASFATPWNYATDIVNKDLTLYAKYTHTKFTATFYIDGTKQSTSQYFYDEAITYPTPDDKTGYDFSGWSPSPTTMPDNDVDFYSSFIPQKFKLVFKDGATVVKSIDFPFNEDITTVVPEKEHYSYNFELPSSGKLMPASDLTINGNFVINCHIIAFKVDGKLVSEEEYRYGATISIPAAPAAKEGYKFSGWNDVPATMPDHDVVIEASYIPNTHFVTFTIDDEVIETVTTAYNIPISNIVPKKEGYVFVPSDGSPTTVPDNDITISGSFQRADFNIYYRVDYSDYKTVKCTYGSQIVLIDYPTKPGYVFSGWSEVPATMPAKNIYVYGTFKKDNSTPVSEITENPEIKVWSYSHTIYIETAPDTKYKIIDINGRIVTTSTTTSTHNEVSLSRQGAYIVIIDNQTFKVIVD